MSLKLGLFSVLLTAFNWTAQANFSDLHFGAGLMNQYIGKFQKEANGDTSSFNHRLTLEAGTEYKLNETWSLLGYFGFLWPGGSEDEQISKQTYYLFGEVGHWLSEQLLIKSGTGFYITSISGEGGTKALRNGTGTTNFFVPDQSSSARNVTLNLGAEYFYWDNYSTQFKILAFNPLNSRNRTFNYALTFHYHFGDSLWAK